MKKSYADMDPLEEIRAIRGEISREFKTVSAYGEYLRKKYPSANTTPITGLTAEPDAKIGGKKAKTGKKSTGRRNAAKRPARA